MTIQPRTTELQGVHAIRVDVAYDTPGIGSGIKFGALPPDSVLLAIMTEVRTAFNAASTNVLTVGTDASAVDILDASALAEAAGSEWLTPITGFECARTAVTDLYVKYAQSGTAASAGSATLTVLYATNLPENVPYSG